MYKIHNAYECRETIKAAGGRWNPDGKYWTLTNEQFASLSVGALASATVEAPPAPITIVEPLNGEQFTLVLRSTTVEQGPALAVCALTERGVIAAWTKCTVRRQRGASSYYDRHRAAKGDTFETDEFYGELGITLRVARTVSEHRSPVFGEAKWAAPADRSNDEWELFNSLEGHVDGCCAWFGNTPKPLVKKIQAAQKSAVFTL